MLTKPRIITVLVFSLHCYTWVIGILKSLTYYTVDVVCVTFWIFLYLHSDYQSTYAQLLFPENVELNVLFKMKLYISVQNISFEVLSRSIHVLVYKKLFFIMEHCIYILVYRIAHIFSLYNTPRLMEHSTSVVISAIFSARLQCPINYSQQWSYS